MHPDTSSIELMMTRRILENGPEINEPMVENGTYGMGNQMRATYQVQYLNLTSEMSGQRSQQALIDEPL